MIDLTGPSGYNGSYSNKIKPVIPPHSYVSTSHTFYPTTTFIDFSTTYQAISVENEIARNLSWVKWLLNWTMNYVDDI